VAEEVRSLALRAKDAAARTQGHIQDSVKHAAAGALAASQVAGNLAQIQTGIGKVADIVAEIAAASKEQASGIAQLTNSAAEMDKVIQQNAASAEQSSAAAAELSAQAEELASMVSTFRLDDGHAHSVAPRPPHADLALAAEDGPDDEFPRF